MQPIKNVSQLLPFTIIPSKPSLSFFQAIWQKISSIASKIFSCFASIFHSKHFFSAKEITFLQDARTYNNPSIPNSLKDKNITFEVPPENFTRTLRTDEIQNARTSLCGI